MGLFGRKTKTEKEKFFEGLVNTMEDYVLSGLKKHKMANTSFAGYAVLELLNKAKAHLITKASEMSKAVSIPQFEVEEMIKEAYRVVYKKFID